ncbi:MAG: aldehyde dehydrogenase [Tannerellaceae bacterium]
MEGDIEKIWLKQKVYFESGATKSYQFRLDALCKLNKVIHKYERQLYEALYKDLHKSEQEVFLTEIMIVFEEIKHNRKNLKKWMKRESISVPYYFVGTRCEVVPEPYGLSLIIAPWNYPIQLLLAPLIGAISAGNCAMLKPSPYVPNVSSVLVKMIRDAFDDRYVAIVEGDREVNSLLLKQRWDYIFFTGSPSLGRVVMQAAAENVTPLTLELGGKSPCIIDSTADVKMAAKRITWGKFLNCGQTCVAPDYLLVHESIKEDLVSFLKTYIIEFYGDNPQLSEYYGRIVNDKAFMRLDRLLKDVKILYGGCRVEADLYIEPTLVDVEDVCGCKLMEEEIFGPILPIISFKDISDVSKFISAREKPLALYCFSDKEKFNLVLENTSSGSALLNDVVLHVGNGLLPFGGVGNSGFGNYHGKESFLTFSHLKSVLYSPKWYNNAFRFPPYKKFKLVKWLFS